MKMSGQQKQYRTGQKRPGGQVVQGKQPQGTPSKTQGGKTHAVKNRNVNHSRGGKR
jgi:hypothetical protein